MFAKRGLNRYHREFVGKWGKINVTAAISPLRSMRSTLPYHHPKGLPQGLLQMDGTKKKKSIATNPSFQQRRKMTFGAPSVHCSLENMRTCDMCSSRLERYGFTLYLYTHRSWPHWQVQCTLIFQCFWHVLEQFK